MNALDNMLQNPCNEEELKGYIIQNGETFLFLNDGICVSIDESTLHIRTYLGKHLMFSSSVGYNFSERGRFLDGRFRCFSWKDAKDDKEWEAVSSEYTMPKRLGMIDKNLTIDFIDRRIIYTEKVYDVYRAPFIYYVQVFDFDLNNYDSYLGFTCDKPGYYDLPITNFTRICSIANDTKYDVYYNQYNTRIIYNDQSSVKVYSISSGEGKIVLSFKNINNWFRTIRNEGQCRVFYSFFVLNRDDTTIILNLKTLKYISTNLKSVIPTDFTFDKYRYMSKGKNFICKNTQFLCVDDKIYNENLQIAASLETRKRDKIELIDIIDQYVAVCDHNNAIHIFYIRKLSKNDVFVHEVNYECEYRQNDSQIALCIKEENTRDLKHRYYTPNIRFFVFVPIIRKFDIDIDRIINSTSGSEYYSEDDSSILDALDGDPEAYWNID